VTDFKQLCEDPKVLAEEDHLEEDHLEEMPLEEAHLEEKARDHSPLPLPKAQYLRLHPAT